MRTVIETDRLRLRTPRHNDAPQLAALAGDERVARMTTAIPHPYPVEVAEGWVMLQAQRQRRGADYAFVVTHDEAVIGMVGAHRPRGGALFELGYWIGADFWGRGYATEAARALIAWLERDLGQTRVRATHFRDNAASARVLEKCGFTRTGDVSLRYSLGRDARVVCDEMIWAATADAPCAA